MKRLLFLFLAISISCILTSNVNAQDRPANSELGIIIGEPTGLSAKFWTGNLSAFDLGLAWSFSGQGSMHIHGDFLRHSYFDSPDLGLYYGLGARLLMREDPKIGARIPLGLQYNIPESRLALFFELAPMLDLVPSSSFDINGGLGLRYFF